MFINKLIMAIVICFGYGSTGYATDQPLGEDYPLQFHPNYLEMTIEGDKWFATNAKESDTNFLNYLFLDAEIMKFYGAGPSVNSQDVLDRTLNLWLPRFRAGEPHGGLIVWDKSNKTPLGFILAGLTSKPGIAGLSYAYIPSIWGKGIGSDVLKGFIEQWAPEVRKRGLGKDTSATPFKCYKGEALSQFEAVVSPDNIGSLKVLARNGFENWLVDEDPLMDFSSLTRNSFHSVERNITDFIALKELAIERGKYYKLIDFEGQERTFSIPTTYESLKYHLMYQL
jgi:RimJ/RimL family protein N-acetyltransferase